MPYRLWDEGPVAVTKKAASGMAFAGDDGSTRQIDR